MVSGLAILPLDALGGDCINYGDYIHLVGSVDTPGNAFGVAVAGIHAYVAESSSGLLVVDISNPASPAIVGSADTPNIAQGVAVAGNYAYVATRSFPAGSLEVVNISNPASPAVVGSVTTPGEANAVAVAGNYAYVAESP